MSLTLSLSAGVVFAQRPTPAGLGRIGVTTFGPAGLSPDVRTKMEEAATAGLRASGAEVVSTTELARARGKASLGACTDWPCEQRLAALTDTKYWLRGTCQVDASSYRLHLELVDARTGSVSAARDDTCDICTEADAAETANVAASALKASFDHGHVNAAEPAAVKRPLLAVPAAAALGPGSPAAVIGTTPTGAQKPASGAGGPPTWRRVVPWMAFAAAAVAGAGGIYYLAINGDTGCKSTAMGGGNCLYHTDTVWRWGVPLLAAGAAFAATGIVLVIGNDSPTHDKSSGAGINERTADASTSTRIVISFDRLAVAGTF